MATKTKFEKKLYCRNYDSQGKKTGGTDSGRRSWRDKKRSVKAKMDKFFEDGYDEMSRKS